MIVLFIYTYKRQDNKESHQSGCWAYIYSIYKRTWDKQTAPKTVFFFFLFLFQYRRVEKEEEEEENIVIIITGVSLLRIAQRPL